MTYLHFFAQNREFSYFSILLTISLFAFLISWLVEPRRLINGILFTIFLILLAAWTTIMIFSTHLKTLQMVYALLVLGFFFLVFVVIAFSWLFCFWNAYFVWKYESHTLPNLLTLLLGISLIAVWIISLSGPARYFPRWLNALLMTAPVIAVYLLFIMYNFLVNLLLYQFVPRHYNQDYLIVLGAGLLHGEVVTPLLAARIDRAIQFANKQELKGRKTPKFIMSGGQGGDEKFPKPKQWQIMQLVAESILTIFYWRTNQKTLIKTCSSPKRLRFKIMVIATLKPNSLATITTSFGLPFMQKWLVYALTVWDAIPDFTFYQMQ